MSELISQVLITWEVQNGKRFEFAKDGDGANYYEARKVLGPSSYPLRYVKHTLRLIDGVRVDLNLGGASRSALLPDKTGVLVVFEGRPAAGAPFFFSPPDNAAIINADGTVRFQLKSPVGQEGVFGPIVSLWDGRLGIRACPKSYPVCESVYVVDGSTDDLSKQIPIWVRD